jgi:hypothetical protein
VCDLLGGVHIKLVVKHLELDRVSIHSTILIDLVYVQPDGMQGLLSRKLIRAAECRDHGQGQRRAVLAEEVEETKESSDKDQDQQADRDEQVTPFPFR